MNDEGYHVVRLEDIQVGIERVYNMDFDR